MRHLGGKALGRALGLPPARTDYTVNRVYVPMGDGVRLVADHYAPTTSTPLGTLLVRGPYGRAFPFSLVYAHLLAPRGYHVVLQSVRGTFGSGGRMEPMAQETEAAWAGRVEERAAQAARRSSVPTALDIRVDMGFGARPGMRHRAF